MSGFWLSDAELVGATHRKQPAAQARVWREAAPLEWGGMLLRPGRRRYSRHTLSDVPIESGIYALATADGDVVYVGKAISLHQRLSQHYQRVRFGQEAPFDIFAILCIPQYALGDVEVAHIHALQPERNRLYEPSRWPGHGAMVAALRGIWEVQ